MSKHDELIKSLHATRARVESALTEVSAAARDRLSVDADRLFATLEQEIIRSAQEGFDAASLRINTRDEHYTFTRAVDGDTIEVLPPEDLRHYAIDMHIRLYGVDTPETKEDRELFSSAYTTLVERLCSLDPSKRVYLILERETDAGKYAGFPRDSFGRQIANVFVPLDGKLLYLNSLLAMLPHVCPCKLRGEPAAQGHGFRQVPSDQCECHNSGIGPLLDEFNKSVPLASRAFPRCLYLFPTHVIHESSRGPEHLLTTLLSELEASPCPYSDVALALKFLARTKEARWSVSPFDFIHLLAFRWADRVGHSNVKPTAELALEAKKKGNPKRRPKKEA
jgi:hypothetical protein